MTKTELELAVDAHGLCAILEALSEIAGAKQEHIQESYASGRAVDPVARDWGKASYFIAGASAAVNSKAPNVQAGHDKNNSLPD